MYSRFAPFARRVRVMLVVGFPDSFVRNESAPVDVLPPISLPTLAAFAVTWMSAKPPGAMAGTLVLGRPKGPVTERFERSRLPWPVAAVFVTRMTLVTAAPPQFTLKTGTRPTCATGKIALPVTVMGATVPLHTGAPETLKVTFRDWV